MEGEDEKWERTLASTTPEDLEKLDKLFIEDANGETVPLEIVLEEASEGKSWAWLMERTSEIPVITPEMKKLVECYKRVMHKEVVANGTANN